MLIAPSPENAPAAGAVAVAGKDGEKQLVLPNAFTRAAREHTETFYDKTHADFGANEIQAGPIDVPAFGYLRNLVVKVTATGGADGLAAVAKHEDGPWSIFRSISLQDTNGADLFAPMDGYAAYLANVYGAYAFETDPATSPVFADIDDATDGNFSFFLRIPVEICQRDALGALPNQQSNATYKLRYTLAPASAVYAVAPDTLPDVRVQAYLEAWTQPPAVDLAGMPNMQEPPARGTVQNWTRQQINVQAGVQKHRLTRTGNLIRNLVMVFRTLTDRDTANFPASVRLELDGYPLHNQLDRDLLRHYMWERYSVVPPAGVFVFDFTHDLDGRPGNEMRDLWLPTTQGTKLEIEGNFGAEGVLDILTNDVLTGAQV